MNIFEWSENDNFLFEDPFLSGNVFNPERNQSIYDLFACQLENAERIYRYDSFQQEIDDCVFQKPIELNSKLSDHAVLDRSIDTNQQKSLLKMQIKQRLKLIPKYLKFLKSRSILEVKNWAKILFFRKNSTYDNFYKSNEDYNESEVSNYIINDNATSNGSHKMTRFGRSQDKGRVFNSTILIGARQLFEYFTCKISRHY